jgi:hypothetical protein
MMPRKQLWLAIRVLALIAVVGLAAAGALVRLVSHSGSYSLVETSDRLQVHVASDSLRPLD